MKKILFIVNPKSGMGAGTLYKTKIEKWLGAHKEKSQIVLSSENGFLSPYSLGKEAAERGVDVVVAVGGDGTINLIVSGLMNSGLSVEKLPKLGIIRIGTGNNFAKNIGFPPALLFDKNMSTIFGDNNTSYIDLGLVRDLDQGRKRCFVNVFSVGFDARVVRRENYLKKNLSFFPKTLTYFLAAGGEIVAGLPSYELHVSGDKFDFQGKVSLLAVLNGPTYGGVFNIAPQANMIDGLLDVCLIKEVSKIEAVSLLFKALRGNHVSSSKVKLFKTRSLKIVSSVFIPREIDGEVISSGGKSLVSIIPGALKVLTPSV
jgi:YegS/Rv2252/BmrU family lipid kinase